MLGLPAVLLQQKHHSWVSAQSCTTRTSSKDKHPVKEARIAKLVEEAALKITKQGQLQLHSPDV